MSVLTHIQHIYHHYAHQVLVIILILATSVLPLMAQISSTDSIAKAPRKEQSAISKMMTDTIMVPDSASLAIDSITNAQRIAGLNKMRQDSIELADRAAELKFNPDPDRAMWMSALFPGVGQIYNRRYWKLPIIVGGYVGLIYATSWNNRMLTDYTKAYSDITDNDPNTKSYMDFYPPTTQESDLDVTWLTSALKSKRDYFRRNRDLCIISMVGLYLICIVDAYVDAQLYHFDISPDLSLDVHPAVFPQYQTNRPSFGFQWALTF